jgi:4-amino-4-deoxy-L-arabinose transferase-like glycosyltransferase
VAVAVAAFLALCIPRLDSYPLVGEDEPWIAAAPAKLASEGVLGNDLFAGYYGMERHHLQHMPVYPLLQAGIFKLLGIGVWQMRILPVVFGAVLLVVVFLVGAQLGDRRAGLIAIAILLFLRTTEHVSGSGILLLDRARVNRYDIAVPVFGLLSLWMFNRARTDGPSWAAVAAGILAGLSTLSHLYGAFWLISLLAVTALTRFRPPQSRLVLAARVAAGFALAVLPWAIVVVVHWRDYLGQMKPAGARFALLDPAFYFRNIVTADGPISIVWAVEVIRTLPASRVGTWLMILGLAMTAWMAITAAVRRRLTRSETALLTAAAIHLVLFTSLLAVKTMSYMTALWPLGALALAWLVVTTWRGANRAVRAAMVVGFAVMIFDGSRGIASSRRAVARVSPYSFYTRQIAACIPSGARVLGLQHYWMGLRQFEYRTWLLPINMSRPSWYDEPLTLQQALARVDPDVILLDRFISTYLDENEGSERPGHDDAVGVKAFMNERGARLACSIRDPSYGTMLVYRLAP